MSIISPSSNFSLASFASGQVTATGLVSGLDVNKIVEGLTAIEQRKISAIDAKKTKITNEQTAFKAIEANLLALQGSMTEIARSQNGLFEARTAVSSDPTALTAAASRLAVPGTYQLRVGSLAKAQMIAAQGFDSLNSSLTHGTLQIKIGDANTTIAVDSSNDTLQGLADALNNSGAALTAAIVSDGSGDGRQGYRLLLSASATGTSNRMTITNNLAATAGGATKPLFDTASIGNAVSAAGNAGTAAIQSNAGAGYTGAANNVYHFTVTTGGMVGADDNLQVAYTDSTGAHAGTITIDSGDVNSLLNVAQGIQVQFGAGTLVAGDSFDVKAFVPMVQDAADASVTLGSGSGALTVTSASNQFDSLIPGVAVNLLASDPDRDLTLKVANDTEKMKKGIQDFVASFNELMSFIDTQINYNADTKQAGLLLGNRQVLTIQDQVRSVLTDVVSGANPQLNHLGALGISTDTNGRLVIDDAKLSKVLTGGVSGVTLADVRRLFALTGGTSNPNIEFVTGSGKTQASSNPYTVNVAQAAAKATLTATNSLAASTVVSAANNEFSITIDGQTSSLLTLPPGTYTRLPLAQAIQATINSDSTLVGRHVNVGLIGDKLTMTSDHFGSSSQISVQSGTALAALGFVGGESAQGSDVVGSYVVNGITEGAHGSAQFLVGNSTNANTADLQLRVSLTPAQVGAGAQANVTVSRGVASRLDVVLTNLFDPEIGRLQTLEDGYEKALLDLDQQKAKQTEIMQSRQQSLLRQFNAMEQTLSRLQSAGNFLTTQFNNLNKDNN